MDLKTIKQIAKDTFRIMSGKADEFTPERTTPKTPLTHEDDFDDFTMTDDSLGETRTFDMRDALSRVKKSAQSVKETISDIISGDDEEKADEGEGGFAGIFKSKKDQEVTEVRDDIASLRQSLDTAQQSQRAIETSLANIERKLNDISASLTGVNKINDSIFDLKNSQINTRNSLNELEVSFRKFKKKVASGVVIISVISAVIAILEILNLLS